MKLLLSILLCFSSLFLVAQEGLYNAPEMAREKTDISRERYQLNDEQIAKMEKIQLRKYQQINKIYTVREQEPDFYIKKLESLEKGTDGSIRLILDERQLALYMEDQQALRKKKAALATQLEKEGKSTFEIRETCLLL